MCGLLTIGGAGDDDGQRAALKEVRQRSLGVQDDVESGRGGLVVQVSGAEALAPGAHRQVGLETRNDLRK